MAQSEVHVTYGSGNDRHGSGQKGGDGELHLDKPGTRDRWQCSAALMRLGGGRASQTLSNEGHDLYTSVSGVGGRYAASSDLTHPCALIKGPTFFDLHCGLQVPWASEAPCHCYALTVIGVARRKSTHACHYPTIESQDSMPSVDMADDVPKHGKAIGQFLVFHCSTFRKIEDAKMGVHNKNAFRHGR
jgi:hypothetical protein